MRDKIIVKQDDLKDCGICSLLSIIRYYGGDASREYLRDITKTSNDGVSAYYLLLAGREMGFETVGVNASINELKKVRLPLIAHVVLNQSYQHFVVIYKIDYKKQILLIMDPSEGLVKKNFIEWQNISTNNYLIFKPQKIIPKLVDKPHLREIIVPFLKKYQLLLIVVVLFSMIYTFVNIITSYNLKLLLDEINISSFSNIRKVFVSLIGFILLKKLTNLFRNNLINYLNHHLDKTLFNDIYNHIINLPYLYYKNRTTGDIVTRINDLSNVKELISRLFVAVLIDTVLVLIVLVILLNISHHLTLIAIITMIVYLIIMLLYNKTINRLIHDNYQRMANVNSYVVETIGMVDTIKSLSLQKRVCYTVNDKYNKLNNISCKLGYVINYEVFFKNLAYYLGNLVILYSGTLMIKDGKMSVTLLITFTSLLNYFVEPIKNMVDLNLVYKNARESLRRVLELYQISEEKIIYNKENCSLNLKGDISFDKVSYSYNGIDKVINNLSLNIVRGQKVLIYGQSGGGKSTLMKLLIKYFQGYQGHIYVDNYDLADISLFDIRKNICYVSQKENLFTDSIYNNVVLDKKVNYERFLLVAKLMLVDELVANKALRYDYLLEENGFNLSGGERQRIILARTLLHEANVYIFDEALNAIDVNKERLILQNMFAFFKDKTIIVVSHRFNNSDLFDRKFTIDGVENECRIDEIE